MGNQVKKLRLPKYIKNFNVENRAAKAIEKQKYQATVSPRHPSTVEIFKKMEESFPNTDDHDLNRLVEERSKQIKVMSKDISKSSPAHEMLDKRPSKEREEAWLNLEHEGKKNTDYDKYGYVRPDKIRPGHLTLRQFDELLIEIKEKRDSREQIIDRCVSKFQVDKTDLATLIDFYKPLYQMNKPKSEGENTPDFARVDTVFPNLKLK